MNRLVVGCTFAVSLLSLLGCSDPEAYSPSQGIDQDISASHDSAPSHLHPQRTGPDEPIGADAKMLDLN